MPKARPTSHRRWLLKMAREADRERLRRARAALKQARELKRSSRLRAREACKAARVAVRDWAKAERVRVREDVARLRLEAKNAIAQRREHARTTCSTGRLEVQTLDTEVKGARATLVSEREQARLQRIWSGKGKAPTGAARAREVRQESDDEVRGNLSGDELYVWERVKSKIKPRDRMSRLEAFQHWMHEHGGEVARILEQQYAGDVARLEREEKAAREAMRPKSYAKASDDDLTERVAIITSLPPPPKLPTMPAPASVRPKSITPTKPKRVRDFINAGQERREGPSQNEQIANARNPPLMRLVGRTRVRRKKEPKSSDTAPKLKLTPIGSKLATTLLPALTEPITIKHHDQGVLAWNNGYGRYSQGDRWGEIVAGVGNELYLSDWVPGRMLRLGHPSSLTPRELLQRAYITTQTHRGFLHGDKPIKAIRALDVPKEVTIKMGATYGTSTPAALRWDGSNGTFSSTAGNWEISLRRSKDEGNQFIEASPIRSGRISPLYYVGELSISLAELWQRMNFVAHYGQDAPGKPQQRRASIVPF